MASVTSSIQIPASPEAVWATMTDPARVGEWQANHAGFAGEQPAGFAEGLTYTQQMRILGMPAEIRWTVDSAQAPADGRAVLTQSGQGPMGVGVVTTAVLEPADGGTAVTLTQKFSGSAVMMVGAQLEKEVGGIQADSLARLKDLVAV